MTLTAVVVDESITEELQHQAESWPARVRALVLHSDSDLPTASEYANGIRDLRKKIDEEYDPLIKQSRSVVDAIRDTKKRHDEPLAEAERIMRERLSEYRMEQERRAAEERKRLEDEALRREQERLLNEAIDAEADGLVDLVNEILDEANAPAIFVPKSAVAPQKVEGLAFRENWKGTVENLLALVQYVAANPGYLNLLQANPTAIGQFARSTKGAAKLPGVAIFSEKTTVLGGRR